MGLLSEFKEFAVKGNAIDMAVGIIMGGAFGKVVSSIVNDVIMPPIGMALGGVNFSDLTYKLQVADLTADPPTKEVLLYWGRFVQTTLDFIIVAFCIFMLVKAINSLKKKEEEKPAAPPKEEVLLTEIRDLLQK